MGYSVNSTYWSDRATIWHDESTVVTGSAIAPQVAVNQYYNMLALQTIPAINDEWTNSVMLEAGTYRVSILMVDGPNSGILTLSLDGTNILTVDSYNAAPTHNQITNSGFTINVTTTGRHVVRGITASKNAASTGYEALITKIWFKRLTDTESHS